MKIYFKFAVLFLLMYDAIGGKYYDESYHIISYHVIPYHIVSCRIVSYRITSHRITRHITSHHITSYNFHFIYLIYFISYHIISLISRTLTIEH